MWAHVTPPEWCKKTDLKQIINCVMIKIQLREVLGWEREDTEMMLRKDQTPMGRCAGWRAALLDLMLTLPSACGPKAPGVPSANAD